MQDKKRNGMLCMFFCIMMMVVMRPMGVSAKESSFDVEVTPTQLSLTAGMIHKDTNAKLTASYKDNTGSSVSFLYQWYLCDENGEERTKVNDDDTMDTEYRISEELAEGTYYYICEVTGCDTAGEVIETIDSQVIKVMVSEGNPVVIFDPDYGSFSGGSSECIERAIKEGRLQGDVPQPSVEGYKFKGWYNKDGQQIPDPAGYYFTHTTRLYAKYTPIYTATFDANGGVFHDGSSVYSVEFIEDRLDISMIPSDPTREGYVFQGWYWTDSIEGEHRMELIPGMDYYELCSDFKFFAKWLKLPIEPQPTNENKLGDVPKTGDHSVRFLWSGVMVISLSGFVVCMMTQRRRRQGE